MIHERGPGNCQTWSVCFAFLRLEAAFASSGNDSVKAFAEFIESLGRFSGQLFYAVYLCRLHFAQFRLIETPERLF